MRNFIKKHTLALTIIGAIAFLAIFLTLLFGKVGDDVYVVGVNGNVSIGTADDLHDLKTATVGMKLTKNNIVVTDNKSSCILSYNKNADGNDNFINIGENSQVMLYDKNSQGGYKFFVTYGSVICNMPVDRSYRTNISTKLFNMFADGTITKVNYDAETDTGKVYTFDGNPMLQTIQPSGTVNAAEKLLKNSVCAVSKLSDGTVGFGCLNVGFGLNEFTAQDLKTMSGVANIWSEKISYGSNEFEQAFQTASDYAKWAVTDPVVISAFSETEMTYDEGFTETADSLTGTAVSIDDFDVTTAVGDVSKTTVTEPDYYTESEYENSNTQSATTFDGGRFDSERVTQSPTESLNVSIPFTAFTRQTIAETDEKHTYETSVPLTESETAVPETTTKHRTTEKYKTEETTDITEKDGTTASRTNETTSRGAAQTPAHTSAKPAVTTVSPTVTTVPVTTIDPNTVYTVIFAYNAGGKEFWSVQLVKRGKAAIAPDAPDVPGTKFMGWDKDFSCVTGNMTVTAVFDNDKNAKVSTAAKEYYTVNLYVEDKLWQTVTVKKGGVVNVIGTPKSSNSSLVFCGWSDNLSNIQSDMTIFALFRSK